MSLQYTLQNLKKLNIKDMKNYYQSTPSEEPMTTATEEQISQQEDKTILEEKTKKISTGNPPRRHKKNLKYLQSSKRSRSVRIQHRHHHLKPQSQTVIMNNEDTTDIMNFLGGINDEKMRHIFNACSTYKITRPKHF